jgi:hypothetical protein
VLAPIQHTVRRTLALMCVSPPLKRSTAAHRRPGVSAVRLHPDVIVLVDRLEVAGMAFREVPVIEVREMLRDWLAGADSADQVSQ